METRADMAAFLSTQLDFIFFFYGLAFLLLGAVCIAIARARRHEASWAMLGAFGFVHGAGEWLDLLALIIGDNTVFAIARTTLMTGSFVLLAEAARLAALQLELKVPGRWVYAPLLALVAIAGVLGGLSAANATARYAIGFTGASGIAAVFALHARKYSGAERRWAVSASIAFALYAVAAGLIVPAATFWPASVLNHGWFAATTGVPIQLVRGLLACWLAFSIWAIWGQKLIVDVASPRYTRYLQKQFVWTLVAMSAILVSGWVLTEYLGGIFKRNIENEARGDIDLIASRLTGETATIEAMANALAHSRSMRALLKGAGEAADRVNAVLTSDVEASGAKRGFVLDKSGSVVAASDGAVLAGAPNYASTRYFQSSLAGQAGNDFVVDRANRTTDYFASQPVRDQDGKVIGVVVLQKSLDRFEADLRQFDRLYFLVDPHGIVAVTNRPELMFRTLWPLPRETLQTLVGQFGTLNDRPLADREIVDGTWMTIGGDRDFLRRRAVGGGGWSIVMLMVPRGIFASRVLGIIITLMMATVTLVYLVGRERWVHDGIQLAKRRELEELARALDQRATTDTLTGLFNRSKFDHELARELARAQRHHTPLSLIIYDVDRFKSVNDTYGHQVGDKVLVQLSRLAAEHIRKSDILARWGGEEFVILVPEATGAMAARLAENLRDAIREFAFETGAPVTCSFGIAQLQRGDGAATLMSRADVALYRAKINGRDRVELAPYVDADRADQEPARPDLISAA